jgi:membrane-associated protein
MFGNLESFIQTASYFGLFGIIFAETGLLLGFFLPGDSLLITAGIVAAENYIKLPLVMVVCVLAAIVGDSTGYWIGRKVGPLVFNRPENRFLNLYYGALYSNCSHHYTDYGGRQQISVPNVCFI